MARVGKPVEIPNFGMDWQAESKWFDEFYDANTIIKFHIADGYAYYQVTGNKRLTLHHVPVFDGYMAHPALLRGLTNEDIKYQLDSEKRLQELLSKATPYVHSP